MTLRVRLLLVLGILLATYAVAALIVVSTQRSLLIGQVDDRLRSLTPAAFATLTDIPPPGGDGTITQTMARPPEASFSDLYIARVDADGAGSALFVGSLAGSPPDIGAAVRSANGRSGIVTVGAVEGDGRYRALVIAEPGGGWLVAAQPLAEIDAAVQRLARTLWIAGGIIAIILGLAYVWIQRLGLRPIARVTAIAEAIAGGDRSRRVDAADARTEAGKLGHAFNVMLDERDAGEIRLRQFVADASHELRTPLTSVRGYLELYQQGAFREQGQLDDVVRRLAAESARMHGLVEDLLALASLDEGRPLRVDAVDLGQVLRDAAQDAQATQPGRSISTAAPDEGPTIPGDEALLTQLVSILVANALAHTPVSVPVALSAFRNDVIAEIVVADRGPGLDATAAAHVFDRFWRGEAARSRAGSTAQSGGAGLGLAIARAITDAHSGAIALDTAPGKGCTFTIRLPVVREADIG